MFSIGLRGRFGNYDYHELALARQKQDFGDILIRIRATRSNETSSHLLSADQSQDHGSTSQTALESRQASIPLSRINSSESPSRQDTPSSADLSGLDRTRELVRLILDSDDIKRDLVAREFLALTEAEFQDILDKAAAILRNRKTLHNRARTSRSIINTATYCAINTILLLGIYWSIYYAAGMDSVHNPAALNGEGEEKDDILRNVTYYLLLTACSVVVMHISGCIHVLDTLTSRGNKLRKLRNQFQEFCASIRESGLRRVCCTDTPCSVSKESITRFFTHTGLASAVVVGAGLAITGIAPCLDALNSADEAVHLWNELSSVDTGNFTSQQTQDVAWWVHFSGTYVCNLAVPLLFMANIFSGLKQDVMELFGGARYRNERVQDTVHNLRALLARLNQDGNIRKFARDLIHQKYIGSPEFMLMDYACKIKLDADTLEMRGLTRDVLDRHGLERADLVVFCSEAEQVMAALPDRTIHPAEALELINDLRFDVSFRNRVLNGLKFEDATYSDGWVRFVGGARTLARLGLGWLAMNSLRV